jgi:hypothetical protein
MALKINTPLHGALILSDNTLKSMLGAIDKTYKYRYEVGVPFCTTNTNKIIEPGQPCEGDSCSVESPTCPAGQTKVGDFHTHPNIDSQRGYGEPSIIDRVSAAIEKSKLACVWGQQDNIVSCDSPVRHMPDAEIHTIRLKFAKAANALLKIRDGIPLSPEELQQVRELDSYVSSLYTKVLYTDRAGLSESIAKVKTVEECLNYYSHHELTERARKAGIKPEGGKKQLCEKLLAMGLL